MIDSFTAKRKYEEYMISGMKLDMSRGKPGKDQLDLSNPMLTCLSDIDYNSVDGTDCRNYGGVDGLPEAKVLMSQIFGIPEYCIIIGGNSSLNMMYDIITGAMLNGISNGTTPWLKIPGGVKFICPSPGYDRHFGICEYLGIGMITVDMKEDGPDMDRVEEIAANDATVKGIWCIPKYSNPTGVTFSDNVVRRLASMETKAKDFRIFWDNAYAIHHLTGREDILLDILTACKEAGNDNRAFVFGSTSKISFPGAGVAMLGTSPANKEFLLKRFAKQTIGPDKINQLRHVRFFRDINGVKEHMRKHAKLITPKFDMVDNILTGILGNSGLATWSKPNGGYFISLNTLPGYAKKVYNLAAAAGLTLTHVGDTYPYGKDPQDRNIRIAPTFPSLEELEKAIEMLAICIIVAGG